MNIGECIIYNRVLGNVINLCLIIDQERTFRDIVMCGVIGLQIIILPTKFKITSNIAIPQINT